MNKFYSFLPDSKRGKIFLKPFKKYDYDSIQGLMIGKFIPNEPLAVRIAEGKRWYDIISFQDPFNFAISERVYKLLKEAGFTGWRSYKIAIEGRSEQYYGFQVLGKCGQLKEPKQHGFVIGYEFDYQSWDGSDFFYPKDTTIIFCTEQVKKLMEINKVTNLRLENISTMTQYNL